MTLLSVLIVTFVLFKQAIATFNDQVTNNEDLSFDCGIVIFRDKAIKRAANEAKSKFNSRYVFPKPYYGTLYDSSLKYMIWPILTSGIIYKPRYKTGIFNLVLDSSGAVVDILALLSNNQFAKCARIRNSSLRTSEENPNKTNGYDCGNEFIKDQKVFDNLKWAYSRFGQETKYPAPYTGNPFDSNKYLMWPISNSQVTAKLGKKLDGAYNIIMTYDGKLYGVVARLRMNNSFIKCPRGSRNPEKLTLLQDELLPTSEYGYQCGLQYFGNKYLEKCKNYVIESLKKRSRRTYPKKITQSQFDEDVWIIPIFPNEKIYHGGAVGKSFLVMNLKFDILTAVIKFEKGFKKCSERMKDFEVILPETDHFICNKRLFLIDWLNETAIEACKRFDGTHRKFPAEYIGPKFDVLGPYFTYPLLSNEFYKYASGDYRVVLNPDCILAGVIYFSNDDESFFKCKRYTDGSLPGGESEEKIKEFEIVI